MDNSDVILMLDNVTLSYVTKYVLIKRENKSHGFQVLTPNSHEINSCNLNR